MYLLYLAKCYHDKEFNQEAYDEAVKIIHAYHEVYVDGVRSGVVYLSVIDGVHYLEAYKDPGRRLPIKVSAIAFNKFILTIDVPTGIIYTVNKGTRPLFTFLTQCLNFSVKEKMTHGYILYERKLDGDRDGNSVNDSSSSGSRSGSSGNCDLSVSSETGREETREHSQRCGVSSEAERARNKRSVSQIGRRGKRGSKKEKKRTYEDDLDNPFGSK
jgi:hypothetical protein